MFALAMLVAVPQDLVFPDDAPPPAPRTSRPCRDGADEIVVCGRPESSHRVPRVDPRWEERPLRPDVALSGGGSAGMRAASRTVGGVTAPALMIDLKVPLGRKSKPARR